MQNKYRVIYTIYKEIEADNADEALDKAVDYGYDDFSFLDCEVEAQMSLVSIKCYGAMPFVNLARKSTMKRNWQLFVWNFFYNFSGKTFKLPAILPR